MLQTVCADGAVDEAYRLPVCLLRYAVSLLAHRHPDDAAAGHALLRPAHDHRRRHVLLTDEGRAYAKPLSETVCAFEQAAFERMEPDERLALVETSEKLQKALNTVLDSAQN